jgi:hypothetical protein
MGIGVIAAFNAEVVNALGICKPVDPRRLGAGALR